MVYCIVSFDFEGCSTVSLHCVNSDLEKSRYLYKVLLERFSGENRRLLELISVSDDYFSESGFPFFWGWGKQRDTSQVTVLESTER